MIPLKLTIKNFVSYGPIQQVVNFEPYNLICLSGKNGHGKSALFDAITWAIWGQARKSTGMTKPDEGLVHLGESQMFVSLDFICNGIYYKVKREFGWEGRKPIANLEFGILDPITNEFKSLTDKTIKLTQTKIEDLIGLSFESFVNSAFLRQGQSNEFSKKTPAERKEVLVDILGLGKLEELKKRAYDKAKEASILKSGYAQQIDNLKDDLDKKVDIQAQAFEINDILKDMLFSEKKLKADLLNLKSEEEILLKQKTDADNIKFQINHIFPTIQFNRSEIAKIWQKYREVRKKQNLSINTIFLETRKNLVQTNLLDLNNKLENYNKNCDNLTQKKAILASYIAQKKQDSATELKTLNTNYLNLTTQKDSWINQNKKDLVEIKKIKHELEIINSKSKAIDIEIIIKEEKQLEKRKAAYHNYDMLSQILSTELEQLILNLKILSISHKPNCPTCQQGLEMDKKVNLINSLESKKQFIQHRISFLKNINYKLEKLIVKQNSEIAKLKFELEQSKIDEIKKTEFSKLLIKLEESCSKYNTDIVIINNNLEITVNKIFILNNFNETSDPVCVNLNAEISDLETNLETYNIRDLGIQINALQSELDQINLELNNYNSFIQELALQERRKSEISKLILQTKLLKQQVKELNLTLSNLNYELKLQDIIVNITNLNKQLEELLAKKESIILKKGSLDQQVKLLEQKQKQYTELKERLSIVIADTEEYSILSSAFGKDGIQAILIEGAIPEIEFEANNLLAKLTNNQAQIIIESVRDLRSGKTKETLDIKIADVAGIRPYEMFSGGEAFRIDFALRIAISKLLARRSGTPLQTLIIDEGFGSQDEEGLAYIMEAIHRIQEDFAKIIIISHLPTLKEQFPVHFLVHKNAYGSAIKVIEQG